MQRAGAPAPSGLGPASSGWEHARAGLFVATLAFLLQLPFFRLWFSQMDEGHVLQFAQLVNEGGQLYRDATMYPLPGAFWILALVFRVFGPGMIIARWLVVIEFALFCGLAYVLVRPLVTRAAGAMLVGLLLLYRLWAFPHWHIYNYSTTALLIQLTMMLLLARFFATSNRYVLGLAGFVYGLGVLCKQDYGAAVLVGVAITLAAYAVRSGAPRLLLVAWFLGPAALVGAATGLYFMHQGILREMLQLTVWNHFVGMSSFAYSSFPPLFPIFSQDLVLRGEMGLLTYMPPLLYNADWDTVRTHPLFVNGIVYDLAMKSFYYGPPAFYVVTGAWMWQRRTVLRGPGGEGYLRTLLLWSVGASLILLVWLNRPQDYVHLAVLTWPIPCLLAILTTDFLRGRRHLTVAVATVVAPLSVAVVAYSIYLVLRMRDTFDTPVPVPRAAGILGRSGDVHVLTDVVNYAQERSRPGETIAAIPYWPIVNFLAGRPAPDPSSYIVWPFPEFPDRDARVVRSMEEHGTNVVVYHLNQFASLPPSEEYAPTLYSYLVDHFEIERVFNYEQWGALAVGLRRRHGAEAGLKLLAPHDVAPESLVEVAEGPPMPEREGDPLATRERWPFRDVLALRATPGGRTIARIPAVVPSGARLRTAVGAHARRWQFYPAASLDVTIDVVADGARERLYRRTLDPQRRIEDRGWFELDLPLEAYAGRSVDLEFGVSTPDGRGDDVSKVGFGEPRLVLTPPERSP